jgi:hypothetical protein
MKIEITSCIMSDHNTIKVEFKSKRNSRKYSTNWRLNNTLLHDKWVTEEIREEITKFLELNENESKTSQNPWDTAKAVLGGKFTAMSPYIKNTERSQINDLMINLKLLGKQEHMNSKTCRRKEIIKNKGWSQWNKDQTTTTINIQRINETKAVLWKGKQDQQIPGKSD